jgi:hypothetical protein
MTEFNKGDRVCLNQEGRESLLFRQRRRPFLHNPFPIEAVGTIAWQPRQGTRVRVKWDHLLGEQAFPKEWLEKLEQS